MASQIAKQVAACNRRAKERGLAGTLTTLDWQRTLEFFHNQCAYCGEPAWTIDHFEPLFLGGGTTHSNCVPSCLSCNGRKASCSSSELESFVPSERLVVIRNYLETIGEDNQVRWRRLCEREPVFARMYEAIVRLKQYCEGRMLLSTEESIPYGYLWCMIFGVEWDPAYYFQVLISLHWQRCHSTDAPLTAACEDALRVLREREDDASQL